MTIIFRKFPSKLQMCPSGLIALPSYPAEYYCLKMVPFLPKSNVTYIRKTCFSPVTSYLNITDNVNLAGDEWLEKKLCCPDFFPVKIRPVFDILLGS